MLKSPAQITLDPTTKERIAELDAMRDEEADMQADQARREQINDVVSAIKGEKVDSFLDSIMDGSTSSTSGGLGDLLSKTQLDALDDLPADFPPEQREVVLREIQLFRDRAAMKDKERKEREEQMALDRLRREEQHREAEKEREKQRMQREGADSKRPEWRKRGSRTEDDKELEEKRREKRQQDMEAAFRERESRWEAEEAERAATRAKLMRSREEHFVRLEEKKARLEKELAEWDDDVEAEKGHDFYQNRERWYHRRRPARQDEQGRDERDRRAEEQEVEHAQRVPDADEVQRQEKEPAAPVIVGRIMTREERTAAQQELIASIPAEKEELFKWQVKWTYMDESLLNGNIKEFVTRKVQEYIGEEDSFFIGEIMELLKKHAKGEQVLNELGNALGDDAEVFTLKLWRRVVYETEARSQG
ncbi:hypothetical protein HK097_004260, partial [Rhizophlyctis rosea]